MPCATYDTTRCAAHTGRCKRVLVENKQLRDEVAALEDDLRELENIDEEWSQDERTDDEQWREEEEREQLRWEREERVRAQQVQHHEEYEEVEREQQQDQEGNSEERQRQSRQRVVRERAREQQQRVLRKNELQYRDAYERDDDDVEAEEGSGVGGYYPATKDPAEEAQRSDAQRREGRRYDAPLPEYLRRDAPAGGWRPTCTTEQQAWEESSSVRGARAAAAAAATASVPPHMLHRAVQGSGSESVYDPGRALHARDVVRAAQRIKPARRYTQYT